MLPEEQEPVRALTIGRYALYDAIASGGMATVYYGRLLGPVGFARTVAIKRLHPHFASDPEFASMFLDEARLAARIQHPNVVQTLDVVPLKRELIIVMEYVHGESLARLFTLAREQSQSVPLEVLAAIVAGALHGLHAAHEAKSERGEPLDLVHRDVSPQNILVGTDGIARVIDFGVAKAAGRLQTTRDGQVKGKVAYMAPEQIRATKVTRCTDVYAVGVVLWEGLTGRRLFQADNDGALLEQVLLGFVDAPSRYAPKLPEAFDAIALRALDRDPNRRFSTAREMALAVEKAITPAVASEVGAWVTKIAGTRLAATAERVAEIESDSQDVSSGPPSWLGRAADRTEVDARPRPPPSSSPDAAALPSQISSISVSSGPHRQERARSRARIALAAGALAIGAAASALLSGVMKAPAPTPAATEAPTVSVASPPRADEALAPSSEVSAQSPLDEPPTTPPIVPVSSSRAANAIKPRVVVPAKDDCRVKYTIDATGRKLYKRQCL